MSYSVGIRLLRRGNYLLRAAFSSAVLLRPWRHKVAPARLGLGVNFDLAASSRLSQGHVLHFQESLNVDETHFCEVGRR